MSWSNLISWSFQILLLVGVGALLPCLLRAREPGVLLRYSQFLLIACLLLPGVQPWQHPLLVLPAAVEEAGQAAAAEQVQSPPVKFQWEEAVVPFLVGGAALRLLWLAVGLWRLRRYREESVAWSPLPPAVIDAVSRVGCGAELRISRELSGPVTFGFRRPVVLLPVQFLALGAVSQLGILCHEFLHIRRRDWLHSLLEEFAAIMLWFHPAVWWLLGQIRLVREQWVDREVVRLTREPEPYLEALLTMAGAALPLDCAPAPSFLSRRHLAQRVQLLVKEVNMSPRKLMSAYSLTAIGLATTLWLSVLSFPLTGRPQVKESARPDTPGINVQPGGKLLHRQAVTYPETARRKGVEGTVLVELSLALDGSVIDGRVLSGPDELRAAALKSALDWHYEAGPAKVQMAVEFQLPPEKAQGAAAPGASADAVAGERVFSGVMSSDVPESLMQALRDRLARFEGQSVTPEIRRDIQTAAAEVDSHLQLAWRTNRQTGRETLVARLPAAPATVIQTQEPSSDSGQKIPVAGAVQTTKLIEVERPVYPPLAKQARIQGTVRMNVTINKEGKVSNIALVSGHPLLAESAVEAVKKWLYAPTLLNGDPVAVITAVDVNFKLPPEPKEQQQ